MMEGEENFMERNEIDSKAAHKMRFIRGEATCLILAFVFHKLMSSDKTSGKARHQVALILGIGVGIMTYGVAFINVLVQSGICYVAMILLPPHLTSIVLLVISMGYLLCIHFNRAFILDDSPYNIDVSGPLMIATQKITSLGFSLTDGSLKDPDQMSDFRKKYKLVKRPSPLQYFSYIFYFQGLMAGPFSFYGDYLAYVEGNSIHDDENGKKNNNNSIKTKYHSLPYKFVAHKLATVALWVGVHTFIKPWFSFDSYSDPEFVRTHSFLYKVGFSVISMLCERSKYYVAFILGDVVCNVAGFGFNGYDSQGNEKWDLLTNVNILKVEFGLSPKEMVDNWNIQTTLWLRHICFDRGSSQQRGATFLLSAIWHGLFPGYYFSFLFGGIFYSTVRQMRRKIRPYFLNPSSLKKFYDMITWVFTQISLAYMLGPFVLLHLQPTLAYYNAMYWWLHVAMFTIPLLLPLVPTAGQTSTTKPKSS